MKTVLYYFTGTGNSLKVARDLAQELGESEVSPIARVIDQEQIVADAERIGIVFPVYMWGMPLIAREFAKKLRPKAGAYIFGLATYGGFPAATLLQLNKILKKNGLALNAGFGVLMPGNYTPLYGAMSEEKQQDMFTKERAKIKDIAQAVRESRAGKIAKNNFLMNFIFSSLIYSVSSPFIHKMDKDYWADDKCDGCAVCAEVCPVNNIKMENQRPAWLHHCEQCLACLQWCPQEAIQFGKSTASRKRYRHPDLSVQDIMAQKK